MHKHAIKILIPDSCSQSDSITRPASKLQNKKTLTELRNLYQSPNTSAQVTTQQDELPKNILIYSAYDKKETDLYYGKVITSLADIEQIDRFNRAKINKANRERENNNAKAINYYLYDLESYNEKCNNELFKPIIHTHWLTTTLCLGLADGIWQLFSLASLHIAFFSNLFELISFPLIIGPLVGVIHYCLERENFKYHKKRFDGSLNSAEARNLGINSSLLGLSITCGMAGWELFTYISQKFYENFMTEPSYWTHHIIGAGFAGLGTALAIISIGVFCNLLKGKVSREPNTKFIKEFFASFVAGGAWYLLNVIGFMGISASFGYLFPNMTDLPSEPVMPWINIGITPIITTFITTVLFIIISSPKIHKEVKNLTKKVTSGLTSLSEKLTCCGLFANSSSKMKPREGDDKQLILANTGKAFLANN